MATRASLTWVQTGKGFTNSGYQGFIDMGADGKVSQIVAVRASLTWAQTGKGFTNSGCQGFIDMDTDRKRFHKWWI